MQALDVVVVVEDKAKTANKPVTTLPPTATVNHRNLPCPQQLASSLHTILPLPLLPPSNRNPSDSLRSSFKTVL